MTTKTIEGVSVENKDYIFLYIDKKPNVRKKVSA